ncbi:uncharacterized protein At4g00950-like [Rhodamnia argentea]|uniref:Uncharacterized protein At4g00950-like n=1 Tax=Rhodamnia argentea TaxID=178133 RepID=A0A8B8QS95_9MYRT|nr:uncharacterized protein At4g00950-like [Rhodamnia argentea]
MANSLEELNKEQDQDPGDGGDAANNLTTPRLSLFSLPRKPQERPGMLTPPLHSKAASVPFKWEEAPGKPRSCCHATAETKPATGGCLDLPPRLLNDAAAAKVTAMPSSIAVHDGPYHACRALSFRKLGGSFRSPESCSKRDIRERVTFGSTRWGFRGKERISGVVEESPRISLSVLVGDGGGSGEESITKVKITRVSRRRSFFSLSQTKSHLWASIYGGLKQAVPWRRGQDKPLTKGH